MSRDNEMLTLAAPFAVAAVTAALLLPTAASCLGCVAKVKPPEYPCCPGEPCPERRVED